jgi:ribonuclease G
LEEIIVEKKENIVQIIILEEGKVVELYQIDMLKMPKVGNVYVGEVINKNLKNNTLFINCGLEKLCYMDREEASKYKQHDRVLVQVKKDEIYNKGAKVSGSLSIAGKNIVLLLNSNIITYSQKATDKEKLENIKTMVKDILPDNTGVILRTSAEFADEEAIISEVKDALLKLEEIKEAASDHEIGLVYDSNDIETYILRELCKNTTKKIFVNDEEIYNKICENKTIQNYKSLEVVFSENANFAKEFGIEGQIEKVYQRKVWLKSGGYIVIDRTEALYAIDVNSGKYEGKAGEDKGTYVWSVNKEAAIEIMRQLRLKNIGGIVVVDFINMADDAHREEIINLMREESKRDRSKVEIFKFSSLGLLELSRRRL